MKWRFFIVLTALTWLIQGDDLPVAGNQVPEVISELADQSFGGSPHTKIWEVSDEFEGLSKFRIFYSRSSIGVPDHVWAEYYFWFHRDSGEHARLGKGDIASIDHFLSVLGVDELKGDSFGDFCALLTRVLSSSRHKVLGVDDLTDEDQQLLEKMGRGKAHPRIDKTPDGGLDASFIQLSDKGECSSVTIQINSEGRVSSVSLVNLHE